MQPNADKRTASLLLGGDMMLARGVAEVIHRVGPSYPLELLSAFTRRPDLFFVNLECAVATASDYAGPPKRFVFHAAPATVQTLVEAGVDLVSLANNHASDAGRAGLTEMLHILDRAGVAHVGAGRTIDEARQPVIIETRGMRLGVLACCDHESHAAAGPRRPGIWHLDLARPEARRQLLEQAAELAESVDHAIVSLHWQANWVPHVDQSCRDLAAALIDGGVRIVWGHSPHHFQAVQWIGDGVAIYSAGDMLNDYAVSAEFRNDRQLLFELELTKARNAGPAGADLGGVTRLRAWPIELEYAHPHLAGEAARRWITQRFTQMCAELGTKVDPVAQHLLVRPGPG